MAELTEAKIEDACKTPVADHVRRFWELVRTQGAVLRVDTPNPLGYDTACFGPPVAAFLASAWTTDQSKGGDANADLSATSGIQTSPDATSPGRECEPAGASEELCRRLEAAADSCDEERFRSFRRKYWTTIADMVRKAANLIRRLEREMDCAIDNCKAFNEAGLKFARERDAALADAAFWKNLQDVLQDDCDKYLARATTAEARAERLRNRLEPIVNFAWSSMTADYDEARGHLNNLISAARTALEDKTDER